jgi:toxin CptA
LFGLWLAGLLVVSLWIYVVQQLDWRTVSALSAVLVTGAAAYIGILDGQNGQLAWDGEVWRWENKSHHSGTTEYELSVVGDFQYRLLLRLQNQARYKVWVWVERHVAPERWLDLRRAVYSPHRSTLVVPPHDPLNTEPLPAVAVSVSMPSVDAVPTDS